MGLSPLEGADILSWNWIFAWGFASLQATGDYVIGNTGVSKLQTH